MSISPQTARGAKTSFTPTTFYWIMVLNRNYDKLREWPAYSKFQDLPAVENDEK